MEDIKHLIRKDLLDYEPYHASEIPYKIKLDANESSFTLPNIVKFEFVKWFMQEENLNLYPDTDCLELRKKLAEHWSVKSENIICGVGSDQIIEYICKVFLEPDDIVIVPSPSFSMYSLSAKLNKAKVIEIPLKDDLSYDIDKTIQVCKQNNPKLLFLCTPNNPTGSSIKSKDIKKILKEIKCPVIIDEAYAEFSNKTMIAYIKDYPNMIVLRTFSKAYGLAGLRVGYGVANKVFIDTLEIVKAPYNLNTLSQKIAIEILDTKPIQNLHINKCSKQRKWLFKELKKIDYIKVYPSDANFIYVESKINIALKLKEKGILIREFKPADGIYKSRITIGTKDENQKVLKILKRIERCNNA